MMEWNVARALLILLIATFTTSGHRIPAGREYSIRVSSKGRSFIVAFTENVGFPVTLALQLSSYDEPCTVQVTVHSPPYNETVLLAKDSTTEVVLSTDYMLVAGEKSRKLVMVDADADISVIAFNSAANTADAMTCLSKQDLGTEYFVFTSASGQGNHFAVGNGQDVETQVNITVSGSLVVDGIRYQDKQTVAITLAPQEVILLSDTNDLTGTRLVSSTPVAVFSGNKCYTSSAGACDIVVEQLYPVQSWGKQFVIFPLMTKDTKDRIIIIAARPNTTVDLYTEGTTRQYHLQPGSQVRVDLQNGMLVNSTESIMVGYLFQGSNSPLGFIFDPFITTVPPNSFSRRYYKFVTQAFYYNYLLIVSHSSSSSSDFLLDHRPLSDYVLTVQHLEGLTGWEVNLGKVGGQHEISHQSETFGIYVYGVESYISYGYTLGQADSYSGPEDPPEFTCLSHHGEYRLPLSLVTDAELSIHDVHLNSPECQARQEGQWAVITMPFDKCGTQVVNEYGKTVYVNTVYGSVPNTTVHRIEVPLRCEMVDNETLILQFHPMVTSQAAIGHHNVSMSFYQSSAFNDPITVFPYEIDLHGRIYVEFKVESDDDNLQIHTENCNSSPSLSPDGESYSLLKNGCFMDSTLRIYESFSQRAQRFDFHVLKFGDSPEVYLLCDVIVCHNESSPNHCTPGCSVQRHKRDLRGSGGLPQSARLTQGPIIFNHGKTFKQARYQEEQNLSTNSTLIGGICGIGLLAAIALIVQRRYYRTQSHGYRILQGGEE
ncbi:IgGFc-binding protein-like [Pleurodeles waltl]|uniref:IgGFc-binding protein-like n=1 Tax=Pleurodeles waltl TaxID=8319 RepID=UPI003709BBBE